MLVDNVKSAKEIVRDSRQCDFLDSLEKVKNVSSIKIYIKGVHNKNPEITTVMIYPVKV